MARAEEARRARIVASARGWLGTAYRHQASVKHVGCDCLGLLRGVWREVMGPEPMTVPPYPADWAMQGQRELLLAAAKAHLVLIKVDEAREGDVLLFRWRRHLPAMHCAVISTKGSLIHAHEGAAVCEVPLHGTWARRVSHAFAFPACGDFEHQNEGGQG